MKKLRLVSMIAMAAVLFATAGCVAQKADEVSDALDKGQVASHVEAALIDLTADRDDREVVDAQDDIDVQVDVGTGPDSDDAQDDTDAQVDVGTGPDSSVSISRVPERMVRIPDTPYPISDGVNVFANQPEDHVAVEGEYYEQLFIASNGSGVFGWTCTVTVDDSTVSSPCDLSGNGLHFEPYGTYQAMIKGTPDATDVGDLHYTITAYDFSDPSESGFVDFDLTVLPEGSDDPTVSTDPCDQPLTIRVVKNGLYDPDDELTPASLHSTREISYEVTGGMPPYTWKWKSVVEDSYHCHEPQEISCGPFCTEGEIQERRYSFVPEGIPAENVCWGNGSVDEWTRNPTWAHLTGESSEEDTETDFTTWKSAKTDGTVLKLLGKFIYDGPLPIRSMSANEDPVELLTVRVKDSCPAPEDDGVMAMRAQNSVTREFKIGYPDDRGKKLKGEVEYKKKKSYGDDRSVKIKLYSQTTGDLDDWVIAEARLDADDLSQCNNDTCDEDLEFEWKVDDKGIEDVELVRVSFNLGYKQIAHQAAPFDGHVGAWSEFFYGKMDVQEIEIGTTHWWFDYDDQDEGNDQMKTKNSTKGPFDISKSPANTKFKRREYPRTFRSKWKSDDDGGNDNDPHTPW